MTGAGDGNRIARKGPKSVRLLTCLPTPATLTAMLYYLHLLLLGPFYSLVSILLRRDQDRETLLLRQQLLSLPKSPVSAHELCQRSKVSGI
jgi:hypothetical protein